MSTMISNDRRLHAMRYEAALNPAVSADEAEEVMAVDEENTAGKCIKCDSDKLIDRIEQRFTPMEQTVDELIRKDLTGQQLRAIDMIAHGVSECAAAQSLGLHRVTLGRWKRYHPAFIAELNRRRDVDLQAAGDRMRMLAQRALSVLEKQVADDSKPELQQRAAIAMLRLSGVGKIAQRIGETSPDDIIEKRAFVKRRTEKFGPIDHGEREEVLIDLARRAESAEVEDWSTDRSKKVGEIDVRADDNAETKAGNGREERRSEGARSEGKEGGFPRDSSPLRVLGDQSSADLEATKARAEMPCHSEIGQVST